MVVFCIREIGHLSCAIHYVASVKTLVPHIQLSSGFEHAPVIPRPRVACIEWRSCIYVSYATAFERVRHWYPRHWNRDRSISLPKPRLREFRRHEPDPEAMVDSATWCHGCGCSDSHSAVTVLEVWHRVTGESPGVSSKHTHGPIVPIGSEFCRMPYGVAAGNIFTVCDGSALGCWRQKKKAQNDWT